MERGACWLGMTSRSLFPVVLCWFLAVAPAAAAFKYVEEGQEAPDFSAKALNGEALRLKEKVGPKALALVFWATWSPRSKPMLDDLETLYKERRDKGFEVIAVNVEHEQLSAEERAVVEDWARSWTFPVVLDEGLSTYYAYGVVATPSLALLDEKGVVRFARASYSTSGRQEVRAAVDEVLGIHEPEEGRRLVQRRDYVPPKKATLHYQKAQVLIQRGMAKKAIRDLEEAAELDPKWAEPRIAVARVYLAEAARKPDLLPKAEASLREAVAIQPRNLNAQALLAEALLDQGKHADALAAAEGALSLEPAFTPAILVKARSLRALGRLEDARAAIEGALEVDPRNPGAYAELGEVMAALGQWREAADSLRKAVEAAFAAGAAEG